MPSAPAPLTGATSTNNSISTFYTAIYNSAKQTLGSDNPLTPPARASNSYIASACAYVWGLPLQQFWEKQGLYTTQSSSGGKPINEFFIGNTIDQTKTIVTPNTQVLYANAFLDLSNQILEVSYPTPETGIYTLIQVIDPYTNVQFSDGSAYQTSTSGISSQSFYWSGASESILNAAKNLNGAIAIANPQAWILGRTEVDPYQTPNSTSESLTPYQQANTNAALDLSSSYTFNQTFKITSLQTDPGADTLPTSTVIEEEDNANDFFKQLSNAVYSNSKYTYYSGITNGELNASGTLYDQSSLFDKFGSGTYSIGLTAASDESGFKGASEDISNGYLNAKAAVKQISNSGTDSSTNYWNINATLGQYKPTYALRGSNWLTGAAVAAVGLGANIAADGTYPQTYQDGCGNKLDSSEDYSISFAESSLPPINNPGSWSITVYNSDNEVITETSNSYYIDASNENATVAKNVYALSSDQFPDLTEANSNSFSLTLSPSSPTSSSTNQTRLPTPETGTFNLVMRLYNPKPADRKNSSGSILSPSNPWIPPAVELLTTTTSTTGPLHQSKIHLDRNGDFKTSNREPTLESDHNGQYPTRCHLRGRGTLVLKGGMDQLTGEPFKGRLLAIGKAEVISPTTTVEWGLKQTGLKKPKRDLIMDQLIGKIHHEMTGQPLTEKSEKQHQSAYIAPHQIARSNHKQSNSLANAMAITNAYLGEIMTIYWKKSQRKKGGTSAPVEYAKKVVRFSKKLATQFSQHPDTSTEQILIEAFQPHKRSLKTNLLSLNNKFKPMDYHDFIEFIATPTST